MDEKGKCVQIVDFEKIDRILLEADKHVGDYYKFQEILQAVEVDVKEFSEFGGIRP